MSSPQLGNKPQYNFAQPDLAAPPPAPWNVSAGAPGHYLPSYPQMWNAPPAQQFIPHAPPQWNYPVVPQMAQSTAFHQQYMKGNPKLLGITLIILGILQLIMGIAQIFAITSYAFVCGIAFWGAVLNIIAGSLSVAAVSKTSMCLIQGALCVSIVISIFSVVGIILNALDFFVYYGCYDPYEDCTTRIVGSRVLSAVFIFTYMLQFPVSLSNFVFGRRAQNLYNQPVNQVFVLYNNAAVQQPPPEYESVPTSNNPIPLPHISQS